MGESTTRSNRAALSPAALAERLGLHEWQVRRAADELLIPARDRSRGWSADLADRIAAEHADVGRLRAAIGSMPDMGTWDLAYQLAARYQGVDVSPDTVRELWRRGHLVVRFWDRKYPVFAGRSIEAMLATLTVEDVTAAAAAGVTVSSDQAAERLGIRRTDFDHAVRAGLIRPSRTVLTGYRSKRNDPGMWLFTVGSVDALAARADVDWPAVRGVRPGGRSPWAKLPDARKDR
jgi:hypothetical protein